MSVETQPDWRRGFTAGAGIAIVAATTAAARSSEPVLAFAEAIVGSLVFASPLFLAWYLTRNDRKAAATLAAEGRARPPGPGGRLW